MKIGFIGLGNMGSSLAHAVAHIPDSHLLLSNHNPSKASSLQATIGGEIVSNREIAGHADLVFLGVKPHLVEQVLSDLQEAICQNSSAIWISMVAGINLSQLADYIPEDRLVRIMPNTPVAIGQGMTTYCLTNPELTSLVQEVLVHSGQVQEVPEQLIDAATALAGCGPAFVYQMIEALTDAGVQHGLAAQDAQFLVAQTLVGTAQMVLQSDKHPAQLRQEVTSPGGSTIAGVVTLEKLGFRYALIKAVYAALKRTKKLGKSGRK